MAIVERDINQERLWTYMTQVFALGAEKDWVPADAGVAMLAVACMVIGDLTDLTECPEFWPRLKRVSNYIVAEFAEVDRVQ